MTARRTTAGTAARPASARAAAVVVLSLLATALTALLAAPHATAARTVDVVLTADAPATVALAPGDSVRFVSGEPGPIAPPHTVSATTRNGSTAWEYTSPPLGPGDSTEPVPFRAAGTYVFLDRRGVGPLSTEQVGRIVVVAPAPPTQAPAPAPAPAPPPADAPPPSGGGQQAPPAPAPAPPAPAGGSADGPSLAGGIAPAPLDGGLEGTLVPPSIADGFGTQPPLAAPGEQVQALRGPLPGGANARGFGLVAVLAALGVVGMASLLVRVLLAEPAARRPLLAVRELSPAS